LFALAPVWPLTLVVIGLALMRGNRSPELAPTG
jgi:hypothetical protein